MKCPRCGSENVTVSAVTETQLKDKHHGCLWWLFVGWWWVPVKWIFFTLPALLVAIFVPKRQKVVYTHKTVCVCQNCANRWNA
jgi:Zn finger protein HypA/HybF involved in hydrogenase expression